MPDLPVTGESTANGCWTPHGGVRTLVRAGAGFTVDSRGSDGKTSFSGTINLP